ncbi:SusC/RagA family TonB-linked outer membrane protein [Spirosoma arcticum]
MKNQFTLRRATPRAWLCSVYGPLIGLLLMSGTVLAQSRQVKGKVATAAGAGLPGVSVVIKGTNTGTTTNAEGDYALSVADEKAALVYSFIGFANQQVVVGNRTVIDVTLSEDAQQLGEIVVTALGIKKEARTIGYTTQQVQGTQLVKAREPNPINSLTGKIAGLTVAPSAELLGKPTLILRGSTEILFVVDGVPINSDTWNVSSDDIETYTVLKGPNAAALYGFRGQNGAIMITTKKGSKDKRKFAVEFNSSTMFEPSYLALPERQSRYGFGANYQYSYADNLYDDGNVNRRSNIWGPRFDGQPVKQYDSPFGADGKRIPTPWIERGANNFRDFMEVGMLSTNNVSISSSTDKADVRISVSNNYQKGMVPNTSLNITNFNLTTGVKFSDRLLLEGSLNVNLQNTPNIPEATSGPEGYTYQLQVYGGSHWAMSDMRDYWKGPQGKVGVTQYYSEYGRNNNPYFMAYEWLHEHRKTDIYGYTRLSYKINDFMNVAARTQITTWGQLRTEKLPFSAITYKTPDIRQGDYREDQRDLFENNTDLLINFDKEVVKNFRVNASLGGNMRLFRYNSSFATTDFLIVPGVYAFSNSKNPVRGFNFRSDMAVLSAYATADFSYKNFLTLGVTSRIDKVSTLSASNRAIFYPSVALSTVVSDYVKLPQAITFMKLRGSWANVRGGLTQSNIGTAYRAVTGRNISTLFGYGEDVQTAYDGPSYENQNQYDITTNLYNNQPLANYSGTIANRNLLSFTVQSYEFGLDAKFLRNRLGLDVTHFTSLNGPQIFPLPVASSTGYSSRTINGLTTQKDGWEVSLTGSVLKNPNGLNWDVMTNWSTYKEKLKEIYDNEQTLYLSGPDHVFSIGDRLDGYYSYNYLRSPDGQVIYAATGLPLQRPAGTQYKQLMGYTNPDYVWAINNQFSYKNFNFSFQFDGRVGGVIRDQVFAYQMSSGNAQELVEGAYGAARDKEWESTALGTKAATPAYVGQGVQIANGGVAQFNPDGSIKNINELTFVPNTKATTVQTYAVGVYGSGIEEEYMMSKTYAKLREVIIGYTLPTNLLPKFIRAASVSVVGRNLLYFAERKDFDLDQYGIGFNATSRSTLRNPSLQSATTRRFGINLNLTF